MPYRIEYDTDKLGVITIYSGIVTDKDLCDSLTERLDNFARLKRYRYAISDCTNVTEYKVTPEGLKKNAEISYEISEKLPALLLVVITPSDLMYGMGRMWETYIDDTGWETTMVRTRQEANEWIEKNL